MRSIGHFIGGKEVKGASGRTADVFEPMTGDVQAKVALASKGTSARGWFTESATLVAGSGPLLDTVTMKCSRSKDR